MTELLEKYQSESDTVFSSFVIHYDLDRNQNTVDIYLV